MAQTIITSQTGVGTTPWIVLNPHITPISVALGVVVTGTVTYTVNTTMDDPNGVQPPNSANPPVLWPVAGLTSQSATTRVNFAIPSLAANLQVTAGTGTATLYVLQAGLRQS